ncbi:MAG TPA: substrate-binding domain-containing protein [Acidimicrobiales bacterium]|nr:substrate-binding domain-containing protein [Acidimicrobiales bacterium]
MRTSRMAIIAAGLCLVAAACSGGTGRGGGASSTSAAAATTSGATPTAKIGVILPEADASKRWETVDRPYFEDAFAAAHVDFVIRDAEGDRARMGALADQLISDGVTVLMIVNLDAESGAAIETKAAAAGVKTIDYDRLTPGGSASLFVSFDDVKAGELQGQGLVDCLEKRRATKPAVAVLNGSPADAGAALLAQGYNSVLQPKFASGEWTLVDDRSVPDWNTQLAGEIFRDMLTKASGKVDGVLAANDGLGGAAIGVLHASHMQVPVTGDGATVSGLRSILAGDQCMTIYKPAKIEAAAAAAAAIALARGQVPETTGTVKDTQTGRDVPAILVTPLAVTAKNIDVPIDDGHVSAADVCQGLEKQCAAAGVG